MADPLLTLDNVSAGYGETVVLDGISLTLAAGESLSILGRNGVGKSTLLSTIMGHTSLHQGRISLGQTDISRAKPHLRNRAGIGFVPQEREIFPSLSVTENLRVAARGGDWTIDRVFEFFPHLDRRRNNRGNQLSGGEQQMLAIGRALMGGPELLLMDEPSEGLAPVIVEELGRSIAKLRDVTGMAIILVEQHTRFALGFSPRCVVMDRGRIAFDGASLELKDNPDRLQQLIGVGGG
ncbi:MAG: ABC transporter ATP-binding protein [Rhodospirillales bacterium]